MYGVFIMNEKKHNKWQVCLLLLVLVLAACMPDSHPPKDPYMEDRTTGWDVSLPNEIIINLESKGGLNSIVWKYINTDILEGFCYPIQTEEDAASAIEDVLWQLYHVKVKKEKIFVEHIMKKEDAWWVANWKNEYYIVLSEEGEVLRSIDLSKNENCARSSSGFESIIRVQVDLARLSGDELTKLASDTGITEGLQKKMQSSARKRITAEKAYQYAIEIAQTQHIRKKYYDDEFRVYCNEPDDVWFVVSCGWIAAFRQEDGELIFGVNYSFTQDKSKPIG